jgi:hypothetical protein
MKKLSILAIAALAAAATLAAPYGKKGKAAPAADEDAPTSGKEAKVTIDQFPRPGKTSTLMAPSVPGATIIGSNLYGKPRKWIVLEAKYQTYAKWQDQLTFTWHVLLDTTTATENKGNKEKLPPFSYFTTAVTYQNIPQGTHAASVCLHPSYLERFGEPKAIGIVVTNAKGEVLAGDCEAEGQMLKKFAHPKSLEKAFWNDQDVMNAQNPKSPGDPMIERRQGLLDRSKTIWSLVNPNDYEMVAQ